jgi:PAS domain S-box-containing protein
MSKSIRVLIVEDNPSDAELMVRELRRAGFEPEWQRVDTEGEFSASLDLKLDVILSDYAMPQFSGLRALELLKESGLSIPFVLVSATIGEETAVKAMKEGAADYLIKDRLTRLGQAVEHVLEQKRISDERRKADQELETLRRRHELILNSAGEGIYGLDLDGNIIFENPKAAALLGWSRGERLGKSAHSTIHHTNADGTICPAESCPIYACMRGGGTRRVSNDVFWRKDGTSFRVDYVCAPIKDEDGRLAGTIITFKNIAEQFAAEMRLKLQEQQYRLLFDTNPSPMWVFDTKTLQILAVNEAACAQYGYSRGEFLELNLKDLRPAEDVPDLIKARALSSPKPMSHFGGQFRHVRKDGSLLLVEVYSGAIVWSDVPARIVTGIDVTERKKAEERLREQADIIDRAHDAITVRDFESQRILFWNKGAERLYGWTAEEAIGQPIGELLCTDEKHREAALNILNTSGEYRGELKQRTKEGREITVDCRSTLVREADGTPRSVLAINTDVTEQKKLETQLLRAQRLESIGTLASGVAHDLNNILTPILMCAEILHDNVAGELQTTVSLIQDSARRGASVVKQVLTFARGVEGERVLIKPSHLVEEMIDIARKTFPKSIDIRQQYPEDLWSIEADPTQLHQVLLNLSVNARDAMPNGGSLTIGLENFNVDEHYASMMPEAHVGPHVMLRVSDTGGGMPRALIDKIFDPFFTTKDVGKGTGLGLSTALGIVKSHGGFISVYSEIGTGTTFKIFLPARASEAVSQEFILPLESMNGNGELILVVDDEPSILRITKTILEKHNYRVLSANDGPEALASIAEQKSFINAVLTDVSMPYMDGVALIRATKKMRPNMAFIVSTGQGEETHVSELQGLNVTNFLTKPYDTKRLLKTIRCSLKGNPSDPAEAFDL